MSASWARLASVLLGGWLMVAPALLDYGGVARANDRIVGPLAVAISVIAIAEVTRPVRWVGLALGGWLLAAPWLLGYGGVALLNSTIVGLLLAALAFIRGAVAQRFGGGWSVLWRSRGEKEG